MDIKPYSFELLAEKVTDSINGEKLAAASAYNNTCLHSARTR